MKVIATAKGYDNKAVREPGEVFDMPEGAKGSWFRPYVGEKAAPAEAVASKEPTYDELLEKAKGLGIQFNGRPKKADLIAALEDAEKESLA